MMKKILFSLVTFFTLQIYGSMLYAADFNEYDLVLVVYSETPAIELGVNLGSISSIDFSQQNHELKSAGTVSLARFYGIFSNWDSLRMGIFSGIDDDEDYHSWLASTLEDMDDARATNVFSFIAGANLIYSNWNSNISGGGATFDGTSYVAFTSVYDTRLNSNSNTPGYYGGLNEYPDEGEAILSELNAAEGYVDMYLYHFTGADTGIVNNFALDRGFNIGTTYTAVIRLNSDGSIVLNPSGGGNNPPVANDDSLSVDEGGTSTQLDGGSDTLLLNDTDDDDDSLTVDTTPVSGPSNGMLTLYADGTFSYTHDGGESTSDSFVYEVNDGNGGTDQATVTIAISPENDVPLANDDSFSVEEGGTATQADLDSGSTLLSNDTDADGDSLAVDTTPASAPSNGMLTLYADGTFSYTHDGSETTADSFVYEVSDGNGGTDQATVSITINITDSDSDGMPDYWEDLYGLNSSVDDSDDDADGDGFSNLTEFLRGTIPNDAQSHPPKGMPWLQLLLGDD